MADTDYVFRAKDALLGAQMLFVAFGALVLVPLLTGLDPNVALFTAGAGTLLFQVITRGKVPVFLASSFAFIPAIIHGVKSWGIPMTLCGLAASGVLYVLLSALIKLRGVEIMHRFLPPIVTGPVIMTIGLSLAPVAVFMAQGKTGDGSAVLYPRDVALTISMISLAATIGVALLGRGIMKLIPIISGIVVGYASSLAFGVVDFKPLLAAPWLAWPNFVTPVWNWEAVIYIVPVAIAPAIEHFGDVLAISSITGKDYLKEPGVHMTLLGDGLATSMAAQVGGPPHTPNSEVSGAVALTKMYNPAIMTWASITALALAFIGKLGSALGTVPAPVMGGIMILLFGAITVVGMNTLVRAGQDLLEARNLCIVAVVLVFGIGGMQMGAGTFTIGGIGLAGIAGVVLNLVLPGGRG